MTSQACGRSVQAGMNGGAAGMNLQLVTRGIIVMTSDVARLAALPLGKQTVGEHLATIDGEAFAGHIVGRR